jgi:hypothetical protein
MSHSTEEKKIREALALAQTAIRSGEGFDAAAVRLREASRASSDTQLVRALEEAAIAANLADRAHHDPRSPSFTTWRAALVNALIDIEGVLRKDDVLFKAQPYLVLLFMAGAILTLGCLVGYVLGRVSGGLLFSIAAITVSLLQFVAFSNRSDGVGKAERARDYARAFVSGSGDALQERAIDLHTERLKQDIVALKRRAFFAFIPGLLLCLAAVGGPIISLWLAKTQQDWHYMLGGSFVAAVLLGAGSVLLRHDNKIRAQIEGSKGEYLYFSRLRTALDLALTLGQPESRSAGKEEYRKALVVITEHLLAAPPAIGGDRGSETRLADDSSDSESVLTLATTTTKTLLEK